jgi:hypothetical protein
MSDITAAPANAISGIKLPGLGDISAFFSVATSRSPSAC